MRHIAQLNGTPISRGHAWHAVSIERESFDTVFRWVCNTYTKSQGTWLCWSDISEIWFEDEKDAIFCVLKWQ